LLNNAMKFSSQGQITLRAKQVVSHSLSGCR
jgi:hypothetical protein